MLNIQNVKKLAKNKELKGLYVKLNDLQEQLAEIGPVVAEVYAKVMAKFNFVDRDGNKITDPSKLYLTTQDCDAYYAESNEAVRAVFPDTKEGYCPALMVKHQIMELENEIVEVISKAFNIPETYNMKIRQEIIDLTSRLMM